ncbi:hypothetical protein [Mucilaginibacter gilvus]|uniref:Uncharacterized protein n=1 Tax=Mucilaginibacter gilvus TaxID=2305909 RepID=A0A3S3UTJ4_9SPHI|nr:hypothetical protein [Mucilaginibacter gilvus]RWY54099.1 hypothetical protein EPL05_08630 [Mucilaginibacter gilvus]
MSPLIHSNHGKEIYTHCRALRHTYSIYQCRYRYHFTTAITIDSLGACQGISYQNGRIFLYGDREVGMIREFKMLNDSLIYQQHEIKLT